MARITIEDCMEKVPNRFQLVQMASIRAKQLKKGARPLLQNGEGNKQVVMALREIAAGLVKPGDAEPAPETLAEPAPIAAAPISPPAAAPATVTEETAAALSAEAVVTNPGLPGANSESTPDPVTE